MIRSLENINREIDIMKGRKLRLWKELKDKKKNIRKKVGSHNLKFTHENWNSKFDNNTYLDFEVNFVVFFRSF